MIGSMLLAVSAQLMFKTPLVYVGEHLNLVREGKLEEASQLATDNVVLTVNRDKVHIDMPSGRKPMQAMYMSMTEKGRYQFDRQRCEPVWPDKAKCVFELSAPKAPAKKFEVEYQVKDELIARVNSWQIHEGAN